MASIEPSGLPSMADNVVIFLHSGFGGGHVGIQLANDDGFCGIPSGGPDFGRGDGFRNDGFLEDFVSPLNRDRKRLVGADHHPGLHLLPGGIRNAVDLDNAVAGLEVGLGRGGVGFNSINYRRLVHKNGVFVVHHVDAGEQKDGQQDIHGGTGNGDQEAVPARMRHELRGSSVRSSMGFSPLILT